MNNFFSHVTNKVTVLLVGIMLFVLAAVMVHWKFMMVPAIKDGEQTKADLLITPYTQLIEQAIQRRNSEEIENILTQLTLLKDSRLQIPMVASITVSLTSGEEFRRSNTIQPGSVPFIAETPVFDSNTSELLGKIRLEYNSAFYRHLIRDAKWRLVIALIAVVIMIIVVQRKIAKLLKPLNTLASHLEAVDLNAGIDVPHPKKKIPVEIHKVWQAVNQLFSRLRLRDEQLRLEHDAAQNALKEKLEAESANKAKTQFLANMSHELRTPLNAIIGYSEMLKEEVATIKHPHIKNDLEKIYIAGRNLLSLINDVLDLSKIEAGKMQLYLEDVKVNLLIDEIMSLVKPLARKNNNEVICDCPEGIGTIKVDIMKLRQSLLNLLSNALKFTAGGKVELSVSRNIDNDKEWVKFVVKDSGIGMSEIQMERLFDAFSQADSSTTRRYGGTGLGLTISQRFCKMMGGEITVDSELGKGSTFVLSLPILIVEQGETKSDQVERVIKSNLSQFRQLTPEERVVSQERRKRTSSILIIDDDPMACDIQQRHLGKYGYEVHCAPTGAEGIKSINKINPDVILLDVVLADMSGWQVLTYVKNQPHLVHIPVVMLTMVDEKNTAYSLGAAAYLTKPIDREELTSTINQCVRKAGQYSVLVVDDDADARKLARLVLENEGFAVLEAENGHLGLMRLAERMPSVILLDLLMPSMNGHEFLNDLQLNNRWRNVPVIALTAMELDENEREVLEGKVEAIIQKGAYSIDQVLKTVRKILERYEPKEAQYVDDMDDKNNGE